MKDGQPLKRRLLDALTMLLVSGLSLTLLIYVGFGEAQRTFEQFYLEKIQAQGSIIRGTMETFLRAGLPMKQYAGFNTTVEPVLRSDGSIAEIAAFDRAGQTVFSSRDSGLPLFTEVWRSSLEDDARFEIRRNRDHYQVVLPFRNKFEVVGHLAISLPQSVIDERVRQSFEPLVWVSLCLSAVFTVFVSLAGPAIRSRRLPWLQIAFAMTFLTMAVFVIGSLVSLYSEGVQAKTKALADTLGHRLSDIVAFNLNIREIDGLDRVLGEYQLLNPDISAAGLTIDGRVEIHTDENLIGKGWVTQTGTYEYVVDLTPPDDPRNIRVAVALPSDIVFSRIVRSVKNFAALFVASAFLAGLFLQIAGSMRRPGAPLSAEASGKEDNLLLDLVKPVFFVAVFLEHLNYAFLPQFMHEVTDRVGLSAGFASIPFMTFYLCFALALIPSGHYAQRFGARPLMYVGLLLAALGLFMLNFSQVDLALATLARGLSGIGQGMLFIGVQSYILATAAPGRKTQGAAIIVLGFQGGMISGMAIGSLLVSYTGPEGMFTLSGGIALALALYALLVVPARAAAPAEAQGGGALRDLARHLSLALRNSDFLRTMVLIGIPAKAVLTGVIIFALPLLLAKQGYREEDIGQIIMIYAAAVVLSSSYVSRLVDRIGRTHEILFWGATICGAGLTLIAFLDWQPPGSANSALPTTILILGVAIVGIAHGFINAPVVTHVAESVLARKLGAESLTATYRFLERVGHIAGPIVISQLFLLGGQESKLMLWVAGAITLFGLIFLVRTPSIELEGPERETA
ncbi:MAG: MFS transporter [Kiloniellales bacterium]|nr:MFS transporter [Kiloniellales bacterium]